MVQRQQRNCVLGIQVVLETFIWNEDQVFVGPRPLGVLQDEAELEVAGALLPR
jgi:lipid-A-disaccharide synthase-like uncharacterized protein